MYLLAKFGGHRSYRDENINSFINCYLDILEKAELTDLIRHISRFLKSGIPIYNSEVPDTTGKKNKKKKKNTGNKAICVSRKRNSLKFSFGFH